jgi:hypothetical protein
MSKPEKFAPAVIARIMRNRYFSHSKSCKLELLGHLYANHPALGFQGNPLKNIAAKKAEIAVYVAYGQSEKTIHC